MKSTLVLSTVILFCISVDALPQTYNRQFQELFFGRQPSARAEAMGRGLTAVTGDAISYYYNPAGTASLKGLNLNASFAGPYYLLDKAYYDYFGASYNLEDYGTAGFSVDYFNYGIEVQVTDEFGNVIGSYTPKLTNYRLNISSEVIPELYVGANLNLLNPDFGNFTVGNQSTDASDAFCADLGIIKSFKLGSEKLSHGINLGSSLINLNSAEYSGNKLPVIFRIGAAYDLLIDDKSISKDLKSYNFLFNVEYLDLFNSAYYGGIHAGMEFTFLEVISLRGGYYNQKLNDYGIAESNESSIDEFTYGLGINVPVNQLTSGKTPIEFKVDLAVLKQPSYTKTISDWDNFHVYTFMLNWVF